MNDTLYYDGKCPLCSHEIRLLTRFKSSSLVLIDIYSGNNVQTRYTNEELLSILHLQTRDGKWHKGLDATVKAWRHTKFGFIFIPCLLYTSPSPRDLSTSRMPSSA